MECMEIHMLYFFAHFWKIKIPVPCALKRIQGTGSMRKFALLFGSHFTYTLADKVDYEYKLKRIKRPPQPSSYRV